MNPARDIGFIPYQQYMRSPYFQRLREMVGVGQKKCSRCHFFTVRIPHHLTYQTLSRETKKDVVGVCFSCNSLATFYDNGDAVPLDELSLRNRWREITSFSYRLKHMRPSDVITRILLYL